MFDTDTQKPMSKSCVKKCLATVVLGGCFLIALVMTADKPAYKTDCVGDTLTCSMETDR